MEQTEQGWTWEKILKEGDIAERDEPFDSFPSWVRCLSYQDLSNLVIAYKHELVEVTNDEYDIWCDCGHAALLSTTIQSEKICTVSLF